MIVASKPPMSIFHDKELRCHSIGTSILTVYGTRASTSGTEYGTATLSYIYSTTAWGSISTGGTYTYVTRGVKVTNHSVYHDAYTLTLVSMTSPISTYLTDGVGYTYSSTVAYTSNEINGIFVVFNAKDSWASYQWNLPYGGGAGYIAWNRSYTTTGGATYLTRASTSATSYLTRKSTSITVYQTRVSTSGTTYLTRESTSNTVYYTRASTSGTTYLTRISTSNTIYQTRASTSGTTYLTRASTSGYSGVSSSSQSTQSWQ